jgi:hypothetical protein
VLRIRDVYPGSRILIFYPSRIPDPKTGRKERGEKKIFCQTFFVATNFPKCKIILFLNCSRKKLGPNFKELWNFLPKKLSISSQKDEFGIRDPRSGINLFRIPDPGVKRPNPGSRIRIRNTAFAKSMQIISARGKIAPVTYWRNFVCFYDRRARKGWDNNQFKELVSVTVPEQIPLQLLLLQLLEVAGIQRKIIRMIPTSVADP